MLLNGELGVPYAVSVHGLDAFSTVQVTGRAGEWCRRISQRVFRSAARVICVSERVREQVLEGAKCHTSVIYNGVDPTLFAPAVELPAVPTILSVGNLIPIKGHDLLLRAIASLLPSFPLLECEIIGDGPERNHLQTLTNKLQIADRVHFRGRQSRAQVAQAMTRCTVFALPSRYEALGCVYLEAMSAGKPVIGCRGQGIAEVIEHGRNGLLVSPDNEKQLTLAISTLLREETMRRQIGLAARYTVLNGFTLVQQAENLLQIYQECAP
jgi:glycosyltransferase involved in cell wall biosynthesis